MNVAFATTLYSGNVSSTVVSCLACGALGPWGRAGRCDEHRIAKDRRRQAKRGDRYGAQHQRLRKAWDALVQGGQVRCARGGELLEPGAPWHLDHLPDGTSRPSCAAHNSAATSRRP